VAGKLTDYVGEEGTGPRGELVDDDGIVCADKATRQSIEIWQRYASPVWMDINPSDTLQKESAREDDDERHICPLQLQVIERAMQLWTNPGDLVLSPFMGIGSEGHVALKMRRRFVGFELKESYFNQAVLNLRAAQPIVGLFDRDEMATIKP
jgi:DNA modification methylase